MTQAKRERVFIRDGYKCVACGVSQNLTIDHILPASEGGLDTEENLQTLCRSCNLKKGNKIKLSFWANVKKIWNIFDCFQDFKNEIKTIVSGVANTTKQHYNNEFEKYKASQQSASDKRLNEMQKKIDELESKVRGRDETLKMLIEYLNIEYIPASVIPAKTIPEEVIPARFKKRKKLSTDKLDPLLLN